MTRVEIVLSVGLGIGSLLGIGSMAQSKIQEMEQAAVRQFNDEIFVDCEHGPRKNEITRTIPVGATIVLGGERGDLLGFYTENRLAITPRSDGSYILDSNRAPVQRDPQNPDNMVFDAGNLQHDIEIKRLGDQGIEVSDEINC